VTYIDRAGARELVASSTLAADPEAVWRHAVSPAGVNRELWPWLRMTFPADIGDLTRGWQPGELRFRSWLLLLGVLPVEYDDLGFAEVDAGRRFLERSRLATQALWEHERVVEPASGGARLTDRVRFVPRLRALAPVHAPVFQAVFWWRHRRLRALFGVPAS